ncbi:hypothetical protein [Legionella tucsonensis]|uniref:Transmembrane protein n=1 Tax=Legionella tucsonensis TaxID=40335 RepID=A0A0W0ZX84_9GAMM|nr:hypothetical protein [Legionella tucsonensis]KTD73759.1 hypothetical protein Ltuc_1606 [Legionella tucsonensis]
MVDLEIVSFFLLIFLGIVFGYIAGRYRKREAENCGEARVRHSLAKYCQNKDAHVLSNITLRLEAKQLRKAVKELLKI